VRSFRERYSALRSQSEHREERPSWGVPIEQVESGCFKTNDAGQVFVTESCRHDPHLLALSTRAALESRLYLPFLRDSMVAPHDVLFLDTETTGLAGGTGTHAFLVGIGFFDGAGLTLRQYFMRSPAEEIALLEELRHLIQGCRLLVTFNGKSFDWPLLDTRFLIHGYRLSFTFDHLDLLHPARRIWKHRLSSCSLTSLEQGVFGAWRNGDVPGYLIPQLYFDYLRDGDARRLSPVFSHNREDIVTLARLMEVMLAAEHAPDDHLPHAEDRVGIGLALIAAGEIDRGFSTLTSALASNSLSRPVRRRGEIELWRVLKRYGRMHEGVGLLESLCHDSSRSRTPDLYPFVELAKYYEHVAHDLDSAGEVVERAVRLVDLHGSIPGRAELIHRLRRIRRKQFSSRV
jgi:uncharacterized protein YprB with RNaseH-like and TPR domain